MRVRLVVVAAVFTISFGVSVAPVLAAHFHTVGEWNHGLGDGTDFDDYLHPYNENVNGHAHSNEIWMYRSGGAGNPDIFVLNSLCDCSHLHRDWDTDGIAECTFYSQHESVSIHDLNKNSHYHHGGWCG